MCFMSFPVLTVLSTEAWKSLTDKVQEARSNARLKELSFDGEALFFTTWGKNLIKKKCCCQNTYLDNFFDQCVSSFLYQG